MELRKGWKGLIACKAARMQQNSHHSHQLAGDVEDVHWAPRRRCCLPRAREKCECKSVINGQEIGNRDGESHTVAMALRPLMRMFYQLKTGTVPGHSNDIPTFEVLNVVRISLQIISNV